MAEIRLVVERPGRSQRISLRVASHHPIDGLPQGIEHLSRAAQVFLQYLQEEGEEEVTHLLALDQGDGS